MREHLLNLRRLPARLTTEEVALLLGFQLHDVPVLVAARLLSPLGQPAANAPKYFAAVDAQKLAQDETWLSRATKALAKHWKNKNSRKPPHVLRSPAFSDAGGTRQLPAGMNELT